MVVPSSPVEALGSHAHDVSSLLIDIIRARHALAAEGHQVSESRFEMCFGSQWRDLLVDTVQAFSDLGYQYYKVSPGGYKFPVVNDCLVYVWRATGRAEPMIGCSNRLKGFLDSETKKNLFAAALLDPMLFKAPLCVDPAFENTEENKAKGPSIGNSGFMPVVLVIVHSLPNGLRSIEWAVAEPEDSDLILHGRKSIWESEAYGEPVALDVESFDRGIPSEPVVEPREKESIDPNER